MILPCSQEHLPTLVTLLRSLNQLHIAHVPNRFHDDGSDDELQEFLGDQLAGGAQILGYFTEGVARGYLLWRLREQPRSALCHPRRQAVLDHIYVEPGRRRRGIARRLVTRFEADIVNAGCSGWVSNVHGFNTASASLMRNAGAVLSVKTYQRDLVTR